MSNFKQITKGNKKILQFIDPELQKRFSHDLSWELLTPERAEKRLKFLADTAYPGLTKQEFVKDTDLNEMFKRFTKTGQMPELNQYTTTFYDATKITDYQTAQNIVAHGRAFLESMPSEIREAVKYNPDELKKFLADPKNEAILIKHGLINVKRSETKMYPAKKAESGSPGVQQKTPQGEPLSNTKIS